MQLECWMIQDASFHFGRHGLGQEQTMSAMPSDSLFAALVARLARTEGAQAAEKFCAPFTGENPEPPFVLSSTLPFAGTVKFFPVPMLARGGDAPGVEAKQLKKVEYVSEEVFRSLLKRTPLAKLFQKELTLQKGKLLLSKADFGRLPPDLQKSEAFVWQEEQRPRVTLDRNTSASNLFHVGQVHFFDGCGLWFGVRWFDVGGKAQFANLLRDLALAGLGAERGVGLGAARIGGPTTLDLPEATGAWVTLSRYLPRDNEEARALSHNDSAYALKSVGGWLDSPTNMGQRRRPVNLIEAGSVIGVKSPHKVPGRVADVHPKYMVDGQVSEPLGHPVYRCGLALAVGLEGGAA